MKPTNKIIEEIVEEFDKMTDDIPSENDSLYDQGGIEEWLKKNSDKHLYENSVYGEPMCDLSQSKISIFLKDSLLRVQESVLEEVRGQIDKSKCELPPKPKVLISGNKTHRVPLEELDDVLKWAGRFNYNKALDDLLEILKKK